MRLSKRQKTPYKSPKVPQLLLMAFCMPFKTDVGESIYDGFCAEESPSEELDLLQRSLGQIVQQALLEVIIKGGL